VRSAQRPVRASRCQHRVSAGAGRRGAPHKECSRRSGPWQPRARAGSPERPKSVGSFHRQIRPRIAPDPCVSPVPILMHPRFSSTHGFVSVCAPRGRPEVIRRSWWPARTTTATTNAISWRDLNATMDPFARQRHRQFGRDQGQSVSHSSRPREGHLVFVVLPIRYRNMSTCKSHVNKILGAVCDGNLTPDDCTLNCWRPRIPQAIKPK
jgi:hypothetical protein